MPEVLTIFLLSILPLGELRLTIPLALERYQLSFFSAMFFSIAGVMTAVIVLLLIMGPLTELLRKIGFLDRLFQWLFGYTRQRHNRRIRIWGGLALVVISANPIPVLGGAWTAALVSFVFNLPKVQSALLILLGTIIAGFIILAINQGVVSII